MEKLIECITANTLTSKLPGYDLFDKIIDAFATREKIKVIVSSPDYQELSFLWDIVKWTKGSKRELLIEGGPRFCQAALRAVEEHARGVEVLTAPLRQTVPWHRRLFGVGANGN
jgi:hypothetical protein